jgi:arylsulfatase A-like enzyme
MKNHHILLLPVALLLGPLVALSAAEGMKPPTKPNIILILADDLGPGDLSCAGATKLKTPNIDRLAAEGVRFTQGYAPSATCTPSRYSLLTGEYAWRQKAKTTSILDGDAPLCIEPGRLTLPAMLREAGYHTGVVGKWHLGLGDGQTRVDFNGDVKPGPLEIGFDYCHIIPATVDRVPCVWIENHKVRNLDPADPIQVSYITNLSSEPTGLERPDLLKQGADKQHSCTIINGISRIGYMKGGKSARFKDEELASTVVAKSIEFIERRKDQPFFLSVGLFEPHVPRVAEPPFVGTSGTGVRGDVIQQLDWQVGEILKTLDRLGLAKTTLVIFTSDNGPWLAKKKESGSSGPLRGGKGSTWEGGVRVPTIAWWPGKVPAGTSVDAVSGTIDLLPTLVTLAGGTVPAKPVIDGRDISMVLLGKSTDSPRGVHYYFSDYNIQAVREGPWKLALVPQNFSMGMPVPEDAQTKEPRLYNLDNDIGETKNIAAAHPEVVAKLTALAEKMNTEIGGDKPEARRPAGKVENPATLYPTERSAPKKRQKPAGAGK